MDRQHAELLRSAIAYDRGDPKRIQHLVKVHGLAAAMGVLEGLDGETQSILEAAAILHDIGIHISEEKYGSCNGKYQEQEGPGEAEKLLRAQGGWTEAQISRIQYLIAHHHTYTDIEGADYQILVEADFLVNLYEDNESPQAVEAARRSIFRTGTGNRLLDEMFAPERRRVLP